MRVQPSGTEVPELGSLKWLGMGLPVAGVGLIIALVAVLLPHPQLAIGRGGRA